MQRPSLVSLLSTISWMARPRLRWPSPFWPKRLVMSVSWLRVSMTSARVLMDFSPATSPAASFIISIGRQLLVVGQAGEDGRHAGRVVEVRVLVQVLAGQRGLGLAADGVLGQLVLQPVVGVVADVADAAAVDDGRLLLLGQEAVELAVVAGGDDQHVDGPLVAVDLDGAVLDHAQVDLHQVLLVLEHLVGEVDAAAGHPRQGAPPQVEAVGVVGVGDVQQALDRLLAQQVDGAGGDLVLRRVLAGDGAQALGQGHGDDLDVAAGISSTSPSQWSRSSFQM